MAPLKKSIAKPLPGDVVEVCIGQMRERGVLLESYEKGVVLLKLPSGYNIGFKKRDVSSVELITRGVSRVESKHITLSGQKPVIDFYLTGGTISSKLDAKTGGVTGLTSSSELFGLYPGIFEIADIRVHSPFMKLSENMDSRDWITLAKLVGKSVNDSQVKGVIVSHGTDTLHYTASALSFMLRDLSKPVVLTYAQRSSDRGSSDARLNLICSAHIALSDIAEVVVVGHAGLDDDRCHVLRGVKCRKMHSTRRDAFQPINSQPFGVVYATGTIEMSGRYQKRRKQKTTGDAVFYPQVGLVYVYPGQDPSLLEWYRKKGYKGLIIMGTGLGHVPLETNAWKRALKSCIAKGMIIGMTSQTLHGRVDPYVYSTGRTLEEMGVVFLGDMLPETAFVKMGWVLAHPLWRGTVATPVKMKENVCGELNSRLGISFEDKHKA